MTIKEYNEPILTEFSSYISVFDSKQNVTLYDIRDVDTHGFVHIKKHPVISDRLSHLFHRGFH